MSLVILASVMAIFGCGVEETGGEIAPSVRLLHPSSGEMFVEGEEIHVVAVVEHATPNQVELQWGGAGDASDAPLHPDAQGTVSYRMRVLEPGPYTVALRATTPEGTDLSWRPFPVVPAPRITATSIEASR